MTPRVDQEAPWPFPSVAHSVTSVPVPTSTRFTFPSAKNPTDWLSGDQNGSVTASVPEMLRAAREFKSRIQSSAFPSCNAANASFRPSGDNAGELLFTNLFLSGATTEAVKVLGGGSCVCRYATKPSPAATAANAAATAHAVQAGFAGPAPTSDGATAPLFASS